VGLSLLGSQFIAGIQHHLPALCAVTVLRGVVLSSASQSLGSGAGGRGPHGPRRGGQDMSGGRRRSCAAGTAVQCRISRRRRHASPYLTLAVVVQAGLDGIRHQRQIEDENPRPLPTGLEQALQLLEACEPAVEWLGADLFSAYLRFKRAEIKGLENLDETEICRRYAEVY